MAVSRIADAVLRGLSKCLWPRARPRSPARVCIYRIGNIGDMVCSLPAIHAIRRAYPAAHLTLLTSPGTIGATWAGELLEALKWLDEISVYHSEDIAGWRNLWRLARRMRAARFDVWIELPAALAPFHILVRNLLAARIVGARWAGGWRIATVRIAVRAQSEWLEFDDEVTRLLKILAELGINDDQAVFPLPLADQFRQRADDLLGPTAPADRGLIAIAPGAKRATNRWPEERFAELGRQLTARGFTLVFLGGPAEREQCSRLESQLEAGSAINLAGRCSLPESCAVLARCALLICNDSGVQHLAAAMGTTCLSLFAARDLGLRWRPYGPQHVIIRKWVPCHTCLLEVCPYDNRCIGLIRVDEVISAADPLLKPSPSLTAARADASGANPGADRDQPDHASLHPIPKIFYHS
ncbi:MAG TPA: glycosyltransferase family 9 protein [Candidatus Binataceae bacterium]|nr:glycosyltransferase family 9 protein [Candidatus Binataceae bacterium]